MLKVGESDQIKKTRLYRLPLYSTLLEGCLSNFMRAIISIVETISDKDYSSQVNLGSLCEILKKLGFSKISDVISLRIRNAISHGRVNVIGAQASEITFHSQERSDNLVMLSVMATSLNIPPVYKPWH